MKKRLFAAVVALILVLAGLPVTALADDGGVSQDGGAQPQGVDYSNDHTAPQLIDVSFNKATFNRGDTLIVTVTTDENESGFDFSNTAHRCVVTFATVDSNDSSMWLDYMDISMTSANQGVLQGSYKLDSNLGGTYTLKGVLLCDAAGNSNFYSYRPDGDPTAIGPVPSRSFTLTSDYVKPPFDQGPPKPVLQSMTVNKKTFIVGDTITYTFKLADPLNIGIHSVRIFVCMDYTDVVWYMVDDYYPVCSPVTGQSNTFTASIPVTADMLQAHYLPFCIQTTSDAGVSTYLPIDTHNDNYRVQVINPARVVSADDIPSVTSFSLSTHDLVQGQSFSASMSLDYSDPEITSLILRMYNADTCQDTDINIKLTRQSDGTFYGTAQFPLDLPEGHYVLSGTGAEITNALNGWVKTPPALLKKIYGPRYVDLGTYCICLVGSDITVHPVITVSGMENKTILTGTKFDPLDGVTAQSYYNGDLLPTTTVTGGSIDTNVAGVYLVKYVVSDKVAVGGWNTTYTYTDYRWIGVSAVQPEAGASSGVPLAVAADKMEIGAGSGATLQKDGKTIAMASEVTDPGTYTLSCGGDAATSVKSAANVTNVALATPKSTVTAVIDQSAPVPQAAWNKTTGGYLVTLKGKDVSGVDEIRYIPTPAATPYSMDDLKTIGTVYTAPFIVPGFGKYTVYTRDKLGNEGVSTINISKSATDSAYLSDIQLTGGSLSRAFSEKTYSYKVNLGEGTDSLAITAVPEWDGSTVTIAGKAGASATIPVDNGKTKTVTVKVKYGKSTHVYTLTIKRAKSSNCDLESLSPEVGAFDQAFNADTTSYTMKLGENTKSVTLKAVVADKTARASFTSKTFSLNPNQKIVVYLKVRAQSGAAKTYMVTITRAKSTDTGLKTIKTSPSGVLSPLLGTATDGKYTITAPAGPGSVTLTVAASGYKATVTMDGSKKTAKKIALLSGQSVTVHIIVMAQAGNAQDYYVTVTRE